MENIALRGRFGICLSSNVCRFGCCLGELEVIQALLFLSSLLEIGGFITMNSWLLYCHDWNEMGTWRTLSWKMIIMWWLRLVIIAYLVSCCQMSLVLYGNCELFGVKVSFWLLEFIPPGAVGLWARTEIFIPLKLFHDNILICNWKPKQKKKILSHGPCCCLSLSRARGMFCFHWRRLEVKVWSLRLLTGPGLHAVSLPLGHAELLLQILGEGVRP